MGIHTLYSTTSTFQLFSALVFFQHVHSLRICFFVFSRCVHLITFPTHSRWLKVALKRKRVRTQHVSHWLLFGMTSGVSGDASFADQVWTTGSACIWSFPYFFSDMKSLRGFRVGPMLDIQASPQLLVSSHVRERGKGLLQGKLTGVVLNGFLLGRVRVKLFLAVLLWCGW